jgi:hypothetical protein
MEVWSLDVEYWNFPGACSPLDESVLWRRCWNWKARPLLHPRYGELMRPAALVGPPFSVFRLLTSDL